MSSPESIIQIEDAAMKDLFDLSAMRPRTVFPGDDFEEYTSHYLDLLVTSVGGVARLHPDAVTCSLHTVGGDEVATYNDKTRMSAYQAWYEPIDQSHTYKQLSFNAQMDSYGLRVKADKGERYDYPFKGIDIAQSNGIQILECAHIGKPFIHSRDRRSGILDMEEGGYFARASGKRGYVPFIVYTIDQLRECNKPRASMAARLAHKQDAYVYERYGNEALFARVLWRMGRELCIAAGIALPDAN